MECKFWLQKDIYELERSVPKLTKPKLWYRCETCKYILCKDQVAMPNTQKVYTIRDYSCASSNVVHIFTCTKCSTGGRFIGETGQQLCTRMNHHRHKINTKPCDMGQHFCNQNHSLQDIRVLILKWNLKTKQKRKIYEFKCMELINRALI
ncbi:hypothetical protein XELAEV_18008074mg [Xenopus laevis]|uniref:Uncharacterized protein n=1 Tax=Xenopus laevis TaxID=8355 RepID=A0A974E3I6_XENLA|nr:hypothetical protein XELAEV_18008074mg [Xenopus laevis]